MEKGSVEGKGRRYLLVALFLVLIGIFSWIFIFSLDFQTQLRQGWRALTQESKRILGWEKGEIPAEEKRIREEVILKKMEEASIHQDWRSLAPE